MADEITNLDAWKLCDQLTVVQAVLLTLNLDPSDHSDQVSETPSSKNPKGFDALFQAITDAIKNKSLQAEVQSKDLASVLVIGMFTAQTIFDKAQPDWFRSNIAVSELKKWLQSKQRFPDFFFPEGGDSDCLNPLGKFHAPKLRAALSAWKAVSSSPLPPNKSVKEALNTWLKENNSNFDLTKEGMEDASKVANWQTVGGAPATTLGNPSKKTGAK